MPDKTREEIEAKVAKLGYSRMGYLIDKDVVDLVLAERKHARVEGMGEASVEARLLLEKEGASKDLMDRVEIGIREYAIRALGTDTEVKS